MAGERRIVLFTRQGCHLCDHAWTFLVQEQKRVGFDLTVIDIDTDPVLAARHGLEVPVVTVNGQIRFRGQINRVLWQRLWRGLDAGKESVSASE
jgi:hypothetical protein